MYFTAAFSDFVSFVCSCQTS